MRVPLDWLKEHIDFPFSSEQLKDILTMRGLEVDSIVSGTAGDVIEIELTPNRGDCASIEGVARELEGVLGKKRNLPEKDYTESGNEISAEFSLRVDIPEKCPVYYLKLIRDISIGDSPEWIRSKLQDCGLRPLNNIVDITNLVMLETGQPLHAFDADRIENKTIVVRNAVKGEKLLLLDGVARNLDEDDIIIADPAGPVAVGGVMGGEAASVSEDTKNVLLEAAFFSPESISRTERRLSVKTDASYRFSRNVDPGGAERAFERAVHLIQRSGSGSPAPGTLAFSRNKRSPVVIDMPLDRIASVLGIDIGGDEACRLLESIGFNSKHDSRTLTVTVPSFRSDVSRPVDVIEEIARLHGYDRIPEALPDSMLTLSSLRTDDTVSFIPEIIRSEGYWETVNHTLMPGVWTDIYFNHFPEKPVTIKNPINVNMDVLRPNLMFGLMEVCRYNINQKQEPIRFYERGPVFTENDGKYTEMEQVAFIADRADFVHSKKIMEKIMEYSSQPYSFGYDSDNPLFKEVRSACLRINGDIAGYFGEISKEMLDLYRMPVTGFSGGYLFTGNIENMLLSPRKFTKWSPYPSVFRDLSLVVPIKLTHLQIYDKIMSESGEIVKDVALYDIYINDKVGSESKSMTYTLEFNRFDRTLTSEEVDENIEKILNGLRDSFGITLRPE